MSENTVEQPQMPEDMRFHHEGLGDQWVALVGNPQDLMSQIVATVLHAGGTRPSWQRTVRGEEHVLMAWPEDQPVRAGVLMRGEAEGKLLPATAVPLLEGLPNNLMVDTVVPWASGVEANIGVEIAEGGKPMWFYTPLYFRDKEDLTPGVVHTFLLAGLAYGMRKALLDELTITQGPHYESYAEAWLAENPDKKRLDVPALKIPMQGNKIIMPGRVFGEYEIRTTVMAVEKTQLDKLDVYIVTVGFPFGDGPALVFPVYVAAPLLSGYEPKVGDDIDAYVWLQGRIMDMDQPSATTNGE